MIWLLYLAAVVAAVSGVEVRERDLKIQDPLRHNPHDRVYYFDGHDKKQKEILQEFNSPDYFQPNLVVDYRYLRTGGRVYVQGPGGQYIILPHGVKSPQKTTYRNYDELLDYVQVKSYNKGRISKEDYLDGIEDDEVMKRRSRERWSPRDRIEGQHYNPYH